MKIEIYRCDVCGDERKEANHWFIVGQAYVVSSRIPKHLLIMPWSAILPVVDPLHICGEQCLHTVISQYASSLLGQTAQEKTQNA